MLAIKVEYISGFRVQQIIRLFAARFKIMEDLNPKLEPAREIYRRIDSRRFYTMVKEVDFRDLPRTDNMSESDVLEGILAHARAEDKEVIKGQIVVLEKKVKSGVEIREVSSVMWSFENEKSSDLESSSKYKDAFSSRCGILSLAAFLGPFPYFAY